jgi:hypothetical protein
MQNPRKKGKHFPLSFRTPNDSKNLLKKLSLRAFLLFFILRRHPEFLRRHPERSEGPLYYVVVLAFACS